MNWTLSILQGGDLWSEQQEGGAAEYQGKVISARVTANALRWEWALRVHRTEKSHYSLSRSVRGSYTRWCHRDGRSQGTQSFVSRDWTHSSNICSMNKCTGRGALWECKYQPPFRSSQLCQKDERNPHALIQEIFIEALAVPGTVADPGGPRGEWAMLLTFNQLSVLKRQTRPLFRAGSSFIWGNTMWAHGLHQSQPGKSQGER